MNCYKCDKKIDLWGFDKKFSEVRVSNASGYEYKSVPMCNVDCVRKYNESLQVVGNPDELITEKTIDPTTYGLKYSHLLEQYLTVYSAALRDGIIAIEPEIMKKFVDQYGNSSWYIKRK
jgi:hypothetical protein